MRQQAGRQLLKILLPAALFMKFIFDKYAFTSGGALGSITLGLFVKELWRRGQPTMFAVPDHNKQYTRSVSSDHALFHRATVLLLSIALCKHSKEHEMLLR